MLRKINICQCNKLQSKWECFTFPFFSLQVNYPSPKGDGFYAKFL